MQESNMLENWEKSFQMVLSHEGGYTNNPRDPGGMTNLGVTKAAWEGYVGKPVDEVFMRKLTPEIVKPFYKAMYWDKIKGDQLPNGVDYAAYDLAVNSGVGRAAKFLQTIAGVTADGVLGPKSMGAIRECNPEQTVQALCDMRLDFLKRLPTFETFGKGWSRRVAEVKDKASGMA
jgi:lysozyme family protein